MNTRDYYESRIMKNVRDIPDNSLPEFYMLLNTLHDFVLKNMKKNKVKINSTGLCGIWEDDRPVEEIIKEMESGRDYFSSRVDL